MKVKPNSPNPVRGADGVKIAGFRKGPAKLTLYRAAAHARRWASS